MTEGRLFAIGLVLWCYQWVLQWAYRLSSEKKKSLSRLSVSLLRAGFFLIVGVLLAVTIHAYLGNVRGFVKAGILGGCCGFGLGLLLGLLKASSLEARRDILAIDLEWAHTASSAVLLASIIMYTCVQAFKIPSGSMQPTLYEGDHLFVSKFYYGIAIPLTQKRIAKVRDVRGGDVVVFRFPSEDKDSQHYGKDFIKRAIAVPGDRVEIKNKVIYVNGESRGRESYTQFSDLRVFPRWGSNHQLSAQEYQQAWEQAQLSFILRGDEIRDNFGPVVVPPGHYFVLGDNRDASYDSRFWGPLPARYLKGKAWFIYWPPKRIKAIQ